MQIERERLTELCEAAGIRGRVRQVLELRAQGRDAAEIAVELGIAVNTVYVHAHTARKKLAAAEERVGRREFYRFLLEECLPGPKPSNPKVGLYRRLPGGGGERVRVSGGRLVTVDDLG